MSNLSIKGWEAILRRVTHLELSRVLDRHGAPSNVYETKLTITTVAGRRRTIQVRGVGGSQVGSLVDAIELVRAEEARASEDGVQ